jgi:type IV pilus assembly protein PilA
MKHLNLKNTAAKGFSLVEMLVVIAVIGVIAAIAIPSIGSINKSATDATAQRNAQNIASMYQAGEAAGVDWTAATILPAPATDIPSAIAAVVAGAAPVGGAFDGKVFRVPNLLPVDQGNAVAYLEFTNGELYYKK